MRRLATSILILVSLGVSASAARGQVRADGPTRIPFEAVRSDTWLGPVETTTGVQVSAAPYARVLTGTTIGAVIGGAAGLALAATLRGESAEVDMFPWAGLVAASVLGSIPGMYAGARIGSGGQGSAWRTGAAAVGGTALGLLASVAVGGALAQADTGKAPEVFGIAIGIAVPLALTSLTEWRTQR
jgi:hypothetical protein